MDKTKKYIFIVYAVLALLIPTYIIGSSEIILNSGKQYKFRMQGFDPFDMFRGNYLNISIQTNNIPTTKSDWEGGDKVYLKIEEDDAGYAYFSEAYDEAPSSGDYMVSKVAPWYSSEDRVDIEFASRAAAQRTVDVLMPNNLGKYFINEDFALEGEEALRSSRRSGEATLKVRVLNGGSRIEDILIGDEPIMDYLEDN